MKRVIEEIKKDKMIYKINGVKTIISLLLVLAASSCSVPWIVFLLGALGLLGGACVFIFKKKVIDKFILWLEARSTKQICMLGTVAVIIGVLLALAA